MGTGFSRRPIVPVPDFQRVRKYSLLKGTGFSPYIVAKNTGLLPLRAVAID